MPSRKERNSSRCNPACPAPGLMLWEAKEGCESFLRDEAQRSVASPRSLLPLLQSRWWFLLEGGGFTRILTLHYICAHQTYLRAVGGTQPAGGVGKAEALTRDALCGKLYDSTAGTDLQGGMLTRSVVLSGSTYE